MDGSAASYNGQIDLAKQALADNSPFIKAITELSDKREISACEDIYAQGGMKLINRGARFSSGFYDRLVAHKLLKPIEQSISVADSPDVPKLLALAHEQASQVPSLLPLLGSGQIERLNGLFNGLKIPPPLAVKLTVMQESRPTLFQHSMVASVISMVLGIRSNLPPAELHALAMASAFHDFGELCIDPSFFAQGHHMTLEERRHLYAHPITGYLMLRDFAELPKGTAEAVLQHHERLDGGGYPYRLKGENISRISRYLAVAEVAASLLERDGADKRIGIKFRMNIQKYDAQAVTIIARLFDNPPTWEGLIFDKHQLIARLKQLGQLFAGWDEFLKSCSPTDLETIDRIVMRVDGLRMMVLEPGFDQCHLEDILNISGEADSEICTELTVLLDELKWQLSGLIRGVERDQLVWNMKIPDAVKPAFGAWLSDVREFAGE